ncbi:MAG: hypothetical protein AB7G48_13750 [Nitrospiraceae bacterium]
MPIIYVHGVATRDPNSSFAEIKQYLRRFVAPVISAKQEDVFIDQSFWGDAGAHFAWNGASRPRSLLLGQGAAPPLPRPSEHRWPLRCARRSRKSLPRRRLRARPA